MNVVRRRNPYAELEKAIGYRFRNRKLLEMALTHRSFRFENREITADNQRLEFLGDAVLGFITAARTYEHFSEEREGGMTSLRSRLTSGKALAHIARKIDLGSYLSIGKGEELSGGRKRPGNLADALEAVIGAVYLDGSHKGAGKIFDRLFQPELESLTGDMWADNPKGKLQEYSQRRWKHSPHYHIVEKKGPSHDSVFTVEVALDDGRIGRGSGRNKQEAEIDAAHDLLVAMNRDRQPRHSRRHI